MGRYSFTRDLQVTENGTCLFIILHSHEYYFQRANDKHRLPVINKQLLCFSYNIQDKRFSFLSCRTINKANQTLFSTYGCSEKTTFSQQYRKTFTLLRTIHTRIEYKQDWDIYRAFLKWETNLSVVWALLTNKYQNYTWQYKKLTSVR